MGEVDAGESREAGFGGDEVGEEKVAEEVNLLEDSHCSGFEDDADLMLNG